uniref:Saccharopine dehydrogenase NADP binding domain-containing protein n=1 Tax=Oncorhynchus tshawytscha TaxID=74940 RepID=A0A8C8EK39_ONCTS
MLTVTSARPENIIIFGASGFNRQFVVEEAQSAEGPSGSLKCALAGQSRQWLEGVLNHASKSDAPYVLTEVAIFMADVSEADSWAIMCQQGLVVLNCVGPRERVFCTVVFGVIGSCGFDSIPADMSILYTRDQFKKAESCTRCSSLPCREAVTWKSAIYGFAESGSLRKLRKKFDHQPLPIVGAKVKKRASLFFSKQIVQHAISFIGSDPWVVRRFQRFLYEEESTLRCNTTTNLDPLDLPVSACIQLLNNPGHVATPVAMVQTAFTILNEPQFLPIKSLSLMTFPGAAFARTTLINHLSRHGLVFSVKRF